MSFEEKYISGYWELSPFYDMVVTKNPFNIKPAEICVARNGFRSSSSRDQDRENMKRIVACVNYCHKLSNQDILKRKYLHYILKDFERSVPYNHSPTPWVIDDRDNVDIMSRIKRNDTYIWEYVVYRELNFHVDSYMNSETSERIVLCVNFCEGYTNEELLTLKDPYDFLYGEEEIY